MTPYDCIHPADGYQAVVCLLHEPMVPVAVGLLLGVSVLLVVAAASRLLKRRTRR